MRRLILLLFLAALLTGPLAACGKKGSPKPPAPAEESTYPRPYPSE